MRPLFQRVACAVVAVVSALIVGATGVGADNPATGTIPSTDQSLYVEVSSPVDGAVVSPHEDLVVSGTAGLGTSSGTALAIFLVDVSDSTAGGAGHDCNGDGVSDAFDNINRDASDGDVLDCELAGVIALNAGLPALRHVDVAIVPWASSARAGDMSPAYGVQFATPHRADGNGNGVADVVDVASSLTHNRLGLFTYMYGWGTQTNLSDAVQTVVNRFRQHPAETKIVYLMTDGLTGPVDSATLTPFKGFGFQLQAFAVNQPTCRSNLMAVVNTVHGSCTPVPDPATLSTTMSGINPLGIDRVEVSANDAAPVVADLDPLGGFDAAVASGDLVDGANTIRATLVATDGGVTTVTADVTVQIPCDERGLGDVAGVDIDVVSGTVHDEVEPALEGTDLDDVVHDVNCDVIDPVENLVIEAIASVLTLLRF